MTPTLSLWRRMHGSPEIASCREVGRVLQTYLDGELDQLAARRITHHLDLCRRCGMQASTYAEIKSSLARHARPPVDTAAVNRLRTFGQQLIDNNPDQ